MWSNGSGVQPKTLTQQQPCFDQLLDVLSIDPGLSAPEKLQMLRKTPAHVLVDCIDGLPYSQFRATSDNAFVRTRLFENIVSGEYASRMRDRGVHLMIGDCRDEHNLYRAWRPPVRQSYEALRHRLSEDYPVSFVDQVLHLYAPNQQLPKDRYKDWVDLFGYIYADLQVHCLERGFLHCLVKGTSNCDTSILRYRVERRMRCADALLPKEWEVTHATDDALWWWGNGWSVSSKALVEKRDASMPEEDVQVGLTIEEKSMCKPLFEAFANFVRGGLPQVEAELQLCGKDARVQGPQLRIRNVLRLRSDGATDLYLEENDLWEKALLVWDLASSSKNSDRMRHDGDISSAIGAVAARRRKL
jgi:carboxylesterase type B